MKSAGGGPALLFERPTLPQGGASRYPVAVNLFGSEKRMALALGVPCLDEIGGRVATLLHVKDPGTPPGEPSLPPPPPEGAQIPPQAPRPPAPPHQSAVRGPGASLSQLPLTRSLH